MRVYFRCAVALGVVVLYGAGRPAAAQTTYSWNYSGTDWNTAASWSSAGVPTSADTAVLGTFDGPTYNIPSLAGSAAAGQFRVVGPALQTATVLGNGNTLTVGTGGLMTAAPFTYRGTFGNILALDNLRVNVATGTTFQSGTFGQTVGAVEFTGRATRVDVRNGTQLRLIDAAGTTNYDLTINDAQVTVRAGAQITNGVGVNSAPQGVIRFHGGGILNVQGADGVASTFTLNQVSSASGHASIGVFTGFTTGSSVQLTVGNGTLQRGVDRYTRDSAGTVIGLGSGTMEFNFNGTISGFTGSTGRLFLAPGATGVPTQSGVITEGTSSNTNSPYVILTGSIPSRTGFLGRFAAINATTGEVPAQLGTARTEANLSSVAANENVVYRPTTSSANATLSNSISPQTVVFEPQGSGQSVNLGGFTLTTPGIIVERTTTGTTGYTFALDGGTIAGPAAALRNVFVLGSANTFFNVGATFGAGGGVVKSGAGVMALTGSSPQMNFGGDVVINQGVLRARIDGATANLGANNVIALRGGTLEADAGGGTSTFSRSLGNGLGQVNFVGGTNGTNFGDRGGGGFSVFNGTLNVNIGGGAALVWNGNSGGNQFFLRSGSSLRLGSPQSNGFVNLQNDLALDDGSAGLPLESRVITTEGLSNLTAARDPSVRAQITGVISGSAASQLTKVGTSTLELTNANTYAGGTVVDLGVLMVSNTSGSATGTGRVVVRDMLLGNGTIAPGAGNGVTVMGSPSTAFLILDREFGTPGSLKIGTAGVNNPVTLRPGANFVTRVNGTTFDPNGGANSYGRLTVRGTGQITVDGSVLTVGLPGTFTPSASDVFGILDNQTPNAITGTFSGVAQDGTVNAVLVNNAVVGTFKVSYTGDITDSGITISGGNDVVLYGFTPVPEPGPVLAACAAAAAFFGLARRARGRVSGQA